jgi:hypothetical protein
MKRRIATLAVASGLAVFALSGLGQAATPRLVGTVGPSFTIKVTKAGKPVKAVKAGMYKIVVYDRASQHNFHLIGPGVNKKTSVAFTGSKTWTVTLKKGIYRYRCDPHAADGMKGSFRVS